MKIQTPKVVVAMIKIKCDVFATDEEHPSWCACRGTGEFTIKTFVLEESDQEKGRDDPPETN